MDARHSTEIPHLRSAANTTGGVQVGRKDTPAVNDHTPCLKEKGWGLRMKPAGFPAPNASAWGCFVRSQNVQAGCEGSFWGIFPDPTCKESQSFWNFWVDCLVDS